MKNPYLKIQKDIEELQKGINDYIDSICGKSPSDKKVELLNEYLGSTRKILEKQLESDNKRIETIENTLLRCNLRVTLNDERNDLVNLKHEAKGAIKIINEIEALING